MDCIEDRDESIRVRALELITGMANKKNIVEIVKKLMSHVNTTESACEWGHVSYTTCTCMLALVFTC